MPGIDKLVYVSTGVPHGSHAGYRFCPKEGVHVRPYESDCSSILMSQRWKRELSIYLRLHSSKVEPLNYPEYVHPN